MLDHRVTLDFDLNSLAAPAVATCSCGRTETRQRDSLKAGDSIALSCGGVAVVEADFLEEAARMAAAKGERVRRRSRALRPF